MPFFKRSRAKRRRRFNPHKNLLVQRLLSDVYKWRHHKVKILSQTTSDVLVPRYGTATERDYFMAKERDLTWVGKVAPFVGILFKGKFLAPSPSLPCNIDPPDPLFDQLNGESEGTNNLSGNSAVPVMGVSGAVSNNQNVVGNYLTQTTNNTVSNPMKHIYNQRNSIAQPLMSLQLPNLMPNISAPDTTIAEEYIPQPLMSIQLPNVMTNIPPTIEYRPTPLMDLSLPNMTYVSNCNTPQPLMDIRIPHIKLNNTISNSSPVVDIPATNFIKNNTALNPTRRKPLIYIKVPDPSKFNRALKSLMDIDIPKLLLESSLAQNNTSKHAGQNGMINNGALSQRVNNEASSVVNCSLTDVPHTLQTDNITFNLPDTSVPPPIIYRRITEYSSSNAINSSVMDVPHTVQTDNIVFNLPDTSVPPPTISRKVTRNKDSNLILGNNRSNIIGFNENEKAKNTGMMISTPKTEQQNNLSEKEFVYEYFTEEGSIQLSSEI